MVTSGKSAEFKQYLFWGIDQPYYLKCLCLYLIKKAQIIMVFTQKEELYKSEYVLMNMQGFGQATSGIWRGILLMT